MVELGGMGGVAAQLRVGIAGADEGLQAAGNLYLKRLGELQELRSTQSSMTATRQAHSLPLELGWALPLNSA